MPNQPTTIPTGLLQSTEYTEPTTVTIKRLVDGTDTEDIISFTQAPEIQSFFTQRGVAHGITQPTNLIAIRVLALELLKQSQHQQAIGLDSAAQIAEYARRLHVAANALKKDDHLVCTFQRQRPITM